jgi:hypothetical protein
MGEEGEGVGMKKFPPTRFISLRVLFPLMCMVLLSGL